MSISAVILAGGKSSRMGQDKSLMPFGGYSTMTEYLYKKLEVIFGDNIYVSTKSDKFNLNVKKVFDKYSDISPINGIISSLENISCDAIFIFAVDMPLISHKSINLLIEQYNTHSDYDAYCFEVDGKIEPTVAIYTKSILSIAKRKLAKKRYKLRELIEESRYLCIKNVNKDEFANFNTLEEYLAKKNLKSSIK